jgi:hypothetical protein
MRSNEGCYHANVYAGKLAFLEVISIFFLMFEIIDG